MTRGVTFNSQTNKWRASMLGAGRRGYLGEFETEDEATLVRQAAELAIDGRVHDQASIKVCGDEALVPLFARRGVLRGWALIDAPDVSLVSDSRWCLDPNGYAVARIGLRRPTMQIVLMPGAGVRDHISGNRLDNRRCNLRWCTARENSLNASPTRNRALPKGVSTTPEGRFRARLMVNRREIRLGHFDCADEAARAYDAAALAHFGEFARLNFPTPGVDVRVAPLDVESDPTTPSTRSAA